MQYVAPLIQTILWVGLTGWVLWRFQGPIDVLLAALTERIKGGSDIKAGPFEISAMRAQPLEQQAARAEEEISEAFQTSADPVTAAPVTDQPTVAAEPSPVEAPASFRTSYFLAEDLAMRAIQAEFGKPISRQVTAGPGAAFDGAFVEDGALNVVEVKYTKAGHAVERVHQALKQAEYALRGKRWTQVRIILALVVEDENSVEFVRRKVEPLKWELDYPVEIRVYALSELQDSFGVSAAG